MQNNLDTQRASAAPRRVWVTPELRSLDVRSTLTGTISFFDEFQYQTPPNDPWSHCDPNYPGAVCVS